MDSLERRTTDGQSEVESSSVVDCTDRRATSRTAFDRNSSSVSEAVVRAVSRASGIDPLALPPLHSTLDPDSLDGLFATTVSGRKRSNGMVTFEYAGHFVTVTAHGTVDVEPVDAP